MAPDWAVSRVIYIEITVDIPWYIQVGDWGGSRHRWFWMILWNILDWFGINWTSDFSTWHQILHQAMTNRHQSHNFFCCHRFMFFWQKRYRHSGYTYMAVWVGGLEVWEIRVMCKIDLKNVFFCVFCICFIFCLTNLNLILIPNPNP